MDEAPRPASAPDAPLDPVLKRHQQQSFIFGIVSVLTAFWLSPVGLGMGIAGLMQTSKARKRSVELGDTPPRRFMPQFVLGLLGTIASSIVMLVFVFAIAAVAPTLKTIFDNSSASSAKYPDAVATLQAAKKDFTSSETVEFGPFDMKIYDVQKGYTPTSEEVSQPREGVVYTKFTADVSYNAARGESYDVISMDVSGWGDALGDATLDDELCGTTPGSRDLEKYDANYKDGYTDTTTITYLCRGSADGAGELTLYVTFFSKILPIVGTEGAPRGNATYTIQL